MDKRWKKLGELIVNYSIETIAGDKIVISMREIDSYPLALAIYEAAIKAGAYPQVLFLSEKMDRSLLKYGNQKQLEWEPEMEIWAMEWADAYIGLRSFSNPYEFWDIPTEKLAKYRYVRGKISSLRWKKKHWTLIRIPNALLAEQAGLDEEMMLDMFFRASFLEWSTLSKKWNEWAQILNKGRKIRILGEKTDLSFSVDNRIWIVDDGHINMPGGEIYTSPIVNTINGCIYFDTPAVFSGREIHDVKLCWKDGMLVEATASTNQDFLNAILDVDEGARSIGEFAFGLNSELHHFCKDLLLDEKIGGTIHIALGRAYPETGGTNKSVIHWDIVKDMRNDGKVFLDDNLIFENGKMLL